MGLYPADVTLALANIPHSKGAKVFVVDSILGSDSNTGLNWNAPLKTIEAAYAKTVDKRNDVILLVGNGTSYSAAAAIVWSKSYTHLLGLASPIPDEQRARIKNAAALATTPFITFSGSGCIVKNISFWHESSNAAALVNVLVSGGRNYFENCQFAGAIGTNNASGARSLQVGGANASGNVFKNCTIGNDTIQLVAGVYALEFVTGAMHTLFEDCVFNISAGATTNSHVSIAAAAGVGRRNIFKRCLFLNETSVAQAEVFTVGAALARANHVLLMDCWFYGAAEWELGNYGIVINSPIAANMTGVATSGLMKITS